MLYVPAYKKKLITSALNSNADALIIDLEDAVPEIFKDDARRNIKEAIEDGAFKGKNIFIRVNPIESRMMFRDLNSVFSEDISGFVLTKVYTSNDMIYFDKLFSQLESENNIREHHFKFIPLIETTSAVMDAYMIARVSSRTIALCFGGEDFLNDCTGIHGVPPRSFDYPRAAIALAARAAGVLPIDTPFLALDDLDGFIEEESISFEMGFAGCQLIHPKQIELAHRCFTPAPDEVKRSHGIIAAIKDAERTGSGVAMFNGVMVGPPMRKRAEKVLEIMKLVEENARIQ